MKRLLRLLPVLLVAGICSSCAYTMYPIQKLESNYSSRMTSIEDQMIMSNVHIFHDVSQIEGDYEVLSYVQYRPIFMIPFFYTIPKQQLKKFYAKAAQKANAVGGNAVVVCTIGDFMVLDVPSLKNVHADVAQDASSKSRTDSKSIDYVIEQMESKAESITKKAADNLVDELKENIETSLKKAKTLDDAKKIAEKINVLEKYNNESSKPSRSITRDVEDYRDDLADLEKKLEKKMA